MPRGIIERGPGDHRLARSEPAVAFLKGDNVRVELAQDRKDAIRVTSPVVPDSLVDIVTGECQLHLGT